MDKNELIKEILGSWEVPGGKSKEQAWKEIEARMKAEPVKVVSMWRRVYAGAAAAACIALAVWFFVPKSEMATIASIDYMTEPYVLPDGSKVYLNADSRLTFDRASWEDERTLELTGHAFIEVEKGSPFTVNTPMGQVQVLGTSFDVFARGEYFEVACHTGKVKVNAGDDSALLSPGLCTEMIGGELVEASEMPPASHAWMEGKFSFTDVTLGRVIEEVEARLGYQIEADGLLDRTYSGDFATTDIQEAMELICLPLGLQFDIMADMTVIIKQAAR